MNICALAKKDKGMGIRQKETEYMCLVGCCTTLGLFFFRRIYSSSRTLFSLTKNLVYKNIEAQIWKKIRTIIRISPASKKEMYEYSYFICFKYSSYQKEL